MCQNRIDHSEKCGHNKLSLQTRLKEAHTTSKHVGDDKTSWKISRLLPSWVKLNTHWQEKMKRALNTMAAKIYKKIYYEIYHCTVTTIVISLSQLSRLTRPRVHCTVRQLTVTRVQHHRDLHQHHQHHHHYHHRGLLIINFTRQKPAYGQKGLTGGSLRVSGAQLGSGKWWFFVTDTHTNTES